MGPTSLGGKHLGESVGKARRQAPADHMKETEVRRKRKSSGDEGSGGGDGRGKRCGQLVEMFSYTELAVLVSARTVNFS